MAYYDEDGNLVEGVLSPEEAKELQEKAEKAAELEAQLQEKETAINKLSQKDLNFKKFKTMTAAEQEAEKAGWSDEKKFYMQEIEALNDRVERQAEATVGTMRERKIQALAGEDAELRKEIEDQYNRLGNEAYSPEEVSKQLDEAYVVVKHRKETANNIDPMNSYVPSTQGMGFNNKKTDFADTEDGQKLAKELGLTLENPKNNS